MKVSDVKAMVPENATIRLVNRNNRTLDINENAYLTKEFDGREVKTMYGERYGYIPAVGITVVVLSPTVREVVKLLREDMKVTIVNEKGDVVEIDFPPCISHELLDRFVDHVTWREYNTDDNVRIARVEIKIEKEE